jgi:hypothetical protein
MKKFHSPALVRPLLEPALILSIILALAYACTQSSGKQAEKAASAQSDSHRKMLTILAETRRKINKPTNTFASEAKLAYIDSVGSVTTDGQQQINLGLKKAATLLEMGDEAQSVAMYEKIFELVKTIPASRQTLLPIMGMAYMRLAERTNCVLRHSDQACIMPLRGAGIHQDKGPARKAVELFKQALAGNPADLDSRWLLNLAYMQLGEYPKGVPSAWLIPGLDAPGAITVQPFIEMAGDLKLDVQNRSGGVIVDDFNNDGFLDIVSSAWGMDDPLHFFRNNGDGSFTDLSAESGLKAFTGGLNLVQTDYNNDGWIDIFVLRGGWQGQIGFGDQPKSLLRNNGDGTFTDVTIDAGLLSFHPTQTATWNDFNNDGWLDVFIGHETADAAHQHPSEFYVNNKNGTFTEVGKSLGINVVAFVKGVASGDYDNDGWPDLFLSTLSGKKFLFRNRGGEGKGLAFENVTEKAGFAGEISRTFPTWFFDYDNDGWLDIMVCNYEFDRPLSFYAAREALKPSADMAGKIYLYRNNRNGTFTNMSPQMNLNQTVFAMGSNFGDIDNDGWLDMYLGTGNPSFQSLVPNRMYKNLGGKNFADVTSSARVGNLQKGHGVAFADLDNDGDQDIYTDLGGAYRGDSYHSSFFLNPGQGGNNRWICLELQGTKTNRAAIGAKITLKFRENGVERMVYREVNSGGSFGCSPLRREIGVGQATVIDEIAIAWPGSGGVQVLKNVNPDQFIKVVEGQEGFQPVERKALAFKRSDGSIPMCAPL